MPAVQWVQFTDSTAPFLVSFASAAAAAPVMVAAPGAAAAAPAVEEKTTFDLVLEDIPADKKVGVYKVVRNIAGIAVNQVKEFTATLPKVLKEGLSKEDANAGKAELEAAGAKVGGLPKLCAHRHRLALQSRMPPPSA